MGRSSPRRCVAVVLAVVPAALLLIARAAGAAQYDGMVVTFDAPIEAVHKAAVDAMEVVGAEVLRQEPAYLEAKRRNHIGFEAGSGGEVLSVSLVAVGEGRTQVKIRTTKTLLGRFGQKLWDRPIADEIARSLAAKAASTTKP